MTFEKLIKDLRNKYELIEFTPQSSFDLVNDIKTSYLSWYFRVTKKKERAKEWENLIKTFYLPPVEKTKVWRCNLPWCPVFYWAEAPSIAVQEVGIKDWEEYYLSSRKAWINYPNYAMIHSINHCNSPRLKAHIEHRRKMLKNTVKDRRDLKEIDVLKLRDFQAWIFMQPEWDYTFSARMAHSILHEDSKYDWIEYNDAVSWMQYNFALKQSFADKLKIHKVWNLKKKWEWYIPLRVWIPIDEKSLLRRAYDEDIDDIASDNALSINNNIFNKNFLDWYEDEQMMKTT